MHLQLDQCGILMLFPTFVQTYSECKSPERKCQLIKKYLLCYVLCPLFMN